LTASAPVKIIFVVTALLLPMPGAAIVPVPAKFTAVPFTVPTSVPPLSATVVVPSYSRLTAVAPVMVRGFLVIAKEAYIEPK